MYFWLPPLAEAFCGWLLILKKHVAPQEKLLGLKNTLLSGACGEVRLPASRPSSSRGFRILSGCRPWGDSGGSTLLECLVADRPESCRLSWPFIPEAEGSPRHLLARSCGHTLDGVGRKEFIHSTAGAASSVINGRLMVIKRLYVFFGSHCCISCPPLELEVLTLDAYAKHV